MKRITMAALALALTGTMPIPIAADPPPFPVFKAKRVKPPAPGASKRITVQIAPRANPAVPPLPGAAVAPVPAPTSETGPAQASPGRYAWFWRQISPKFEASGPGRLATALKAMSQPPAGAAVATPRLQDLQDIAKRHAVDLLTATVGTSVSPAFALAVIAIESAGDATAESGAGAQGLMQLMPATARGFDVEDAFDSRQNIRGGVAFLDHLMTVYAGDPILVLAAYNAGETRVAEAGGVPAFAETRDYVPKVLAAFAVARGLCLTPPQLVSDGCVFRVMRGDG